MSKLIELLKRSVERFETMSPVERALMEAQQKRSLVIGDTGCDPGLEPLVLEVLRLRDELVKVRGDLDPKETERLERLKSRAYHLQNKIEERPRYNMDRSKAELSALCWAIEKITGRPFDAGGSATSGE